MVGIIYYNGYHYWAEVKHGDTWHWKDMEAFTRVVGKHPEIKDPKLIDMVLYRKK